ASRQAEHYGQSGIAQDEISTLGRVHANLRTITGSMDSRLRKPPRHDRQEILELRDEALATAHMADDLRGLAEHYHATGYADKADNAVLGGLAERAADIGEQVKKFYALSVVRLSILADAKLADE